MNRPLPEGVLLVFDNVKFFLFSLGIADSYDAKIAIPHGLAIIITPFLPE